MGMLKECYTQNVGAQGDFREDGSFPIHLQESMGIWWFCVCHVQCTCSKVCCAGWKMYRNMYTYVVQDGLRHVTSSISCLNEVKNMIAHYTPDHNQHIVTLCLHGGVVPSIDETLT
jgi:hypothetical protein